MQPLSIELRYLIYVAVILGFIWVPYILAHISQVGLVKALSYPDTAEMPAWAARLKRAHYNLVENIPLFAVAVVVGEFRGVHTAVTAACAAIFFWARVAHPIAAVAHIWGTRTAAFAVGWGAAIVYLFVVLTA
ncbi:MAG: MAPEG family protein [Xanthobacteraceae bacterium]